MLATPLGNINITLDSISIPYEIIPILDPQLFPSVNGAYLLKIDFCGDGKPHKLACFLDDKAVKGHTESGERLEAISFYIDQNKLTIGCEGWFGYPEEYNYDYDGEYLTNGLSITIFPQTKDKSFFFGIAWVCPCTEDNDIQTWLAADPTITGKKQS